MAGAETRRGRAPINYWPGWVDALATLLMVIMFLLMVFVVAQFYLREALSGREKTLKDLSGQIAEIAEMLNLERQTTARLSTELRATIADRDDLSNRLGAITQRLEKAEGEAWQSQMRAGEAEKRAKDSQAGVDALVKQFLVLQADRDRLAKLLAEEVAKLKQSDASNADLARQLAETTKSADAAQQRIDQLTREISGLQALKEQLEAEVKARLGEAKTASDRAVDLEAQIKAAAERAAGLEAQARTAAERAAGLEAQLRQNQQTLDAEKAGAAQARDVVALLGRQVAALREQLAQVSAALDLSEAKTKSQEAQIADLGRRLNVALASKVQELARYRSEFFGKLRELLGERQDIRIVGDRFVFQSEVLFDSGSAEIGPAGRKQLGDLAAALKQIMATIPPEINWVLRVDGHTDRQPIARLYKSNWELSFARALAVVRYLIGEGIPPERLAATGFGEFQPIDERDDEIGRRRNRRIELKFDQL